MIRPALRKRLSALSLVVLLAEILNHTATSTISIPRTYSTTSSSVRTSLVADVNRVVVSPVVPTTSSISTMEDADSVMKMESQ